MVKNCWRKSTATLTAKYCSEVYDQEDADATTPLVINAVPPKYTNIYPYHGKAAEASATASSLAQSLGWSTGWAFVNTLGTHAALVEVNISHIVLYRNSIKLADFLTLTASDASNATSLLSHSSLVVVHALRTLRFIADYDRLRDDCLRSFYSLLRFLWSNFQGLPTF